MLNPFTCAEINPANSRLAELAKSIEVPSDRVLNQSVDRFSKSLDQRDVTTLSNKETGLKREFEVRKNLEEMYLDSEEYEITSEAYLMNKEVCNRNIEFDSPNNELEKTEIKDMDSLSIEEEFSPESFENLNIDNSTTESFEDQSNNIERTSMFENQTVDNFDLEERRIELEDRFTLGQPHDAGVLRDNLEVAMDSKTDESVSRAHHIVGNETPNAAKKLEEFGIDRNDPANGILLPNDASSPLKGSIHSGRHLQEYYNTVEQRMAQATTREEVLEVLQSLKEDLYSGDLPLQRYVQPNK